MPARRFRVVVQAIRSASTAGALTLLVGFGAMNVITSPQPTEPAEQLGMQSGPLDDMMQLNRCSFTGFDRDVIPSKAIVRTPEGDTELVSFDHGWAVFSGEVAGELVAVCLGAAAPTTAPG
ncbi:hypothetical protein ASD81_09465 [Nocardioides sp. Root614]|nr:hypothetical protein ASD81_09465 [Nocardioides sp. Root614]KRA92768.1 hypothetical protein ASD84_09730 [Nocardioides sp. Root682]